MNSKENSKNNTDNEEPYFLKHIRLHGLNCSEQEKEYMENFYNDYEDKAHDMYEKYMKSNNNNEEIKNPEPIKEEAKKNNFDLAILDFKNKEPGEDKFSKKQPFNRRDHMNLSFKNVYNAELNNDNDSTIRNINEERQNLRKKAAEQYSSSSDSFN